MPLQLLQYSPGVVKDITDYSAGKNGPYWIDSDHVRFKNGYPEKIGGWLKDVINGLTPSGSGSDVETKLQGVARRMVFWRSFTDGEDRIIVGTHTHLYIVRDNYLYDITPLRSTSSDLSDPFQTTAESNIIVVTDVDHSASDQDFIVISEAEAVGGFAADILNRSSGFQITLISGSSYSIEMPTPATSTATGGGTSVDIKHLIGNAEGLGSRSATPARGYSIGRWSESTWGTPRAEASTDINLDNSSWNLDLWGEDVLATVRNGAIYQWSPGNLEPVPRATSVLKDANAIAVPPTVRVTSVSFPDRHFVVGGCVPFGISNAPVDNMLIRWSSQENFKSFDPFLPGSTSGDQRLEIGTKIVAITPAREETIISTDEAIYGMNFVGGDFIFSFRLLSADAAASGLNSTISIDGDIYWMGETNFFKYDGIVRKLVCPVQYHVFNRLDKQYIEKVVVGGNKKYKEVTWFYTSNENPDATNTENDSYVTYNYEEKVWTIGTLNRSVWSDSFGFKDVPFAFSPDGYLYNHETGTSADERPMVAYIEGSSRELTSEGNSLYMIDKIIPDANMSNSTNLSVYMSTKKYPNATPIQKGPFNVDRTTEKISTRARGRQISMKFESDGIDDQWTLGVFRVNTVESGLR